jgi:hypothetical protein
MSKLTDEQCTYLIESRKMLLEDVSKFIKENKDLSRKVYIYEGVIGLLIAWLIMMYVV